MERPSLAFTGSSKQREDYIPKQSMIYVEYDTGHVFMWTGAQWLQEFYVLFAEGDRLQPRRYGYGFDCNGECGLDLEDRFARLWANDHDEAQSEAARIFCEQYEVVTPLPVIGGKRELLL